MSSLVIALPMPVNLGNARMHWAVKLKNKKAYFATLDTLASVYLKAGPPEFLPYRVVPPPRIPMHKATVRAHAVLGGSMDDDNLMARMKYPMDWLVRRGYIVDDKREHLRWEGIPTQEVSRKQASHMVLTFTEVDSWT